MILSSNIRISARLIPSFQRSIQQHAIASTTSTGMSSVSLFGTKAKVKKDSLQTYKDEKKAKKEYRTQAMHKRQERKANLKDRRNHSPKNVKKNAFRSWFDDKREIELYYNRAAKREQKLWKMKLGLMIERLPVVTDERNDWELDFLNMQANLDRERRPIYPKEIVGFEDPTDSKILTMEELYAQLPEDFQPAPRITEADKNNIIQTLERKLSDRLYLALRANDDIGWSLPMTELNIENNDETFVDGVRRFIKSNKMLEDLNILCLSNCPMAVDVVKYDEGDEKNESSKFFGEKIFYMRVQYDSGDIGNVDKSLDDWGWLERSEMIERVKSEKGDDASKFYHYML